MTVKLVESKQFKIFLTPDYQYYFKKDTGYFMRWGKTKEDNPTYSKYGPEIADIEISHGKDCLNCKYCYKRNGSDSDSDTYNMTLDQFKVIISKLPYTVCQIAFGIMHIETNPDFFPIMEYTRTQGIIPNYTTNGFQVTEEVARKTKELCGAVAVSLHQRDVAYEAIRKFIAAGMNQVNIHYVLSRETYDEAFNIVDNIVSDPRLKGMNAIVFLKYKPKGNNIGSFNSVSLEEYKTLLDYCTKAGINWGMDSCSAPMAFKTFEDSSDYEKMSTIIESCESTRFSMYCNCKGDFYPCSFTEDEPGWETGLSILECDNFLTDIWNHPKTVEFRNRLLYSTTKCVGCISKSDCCACPTFDITPCRRIE